MAVFMRVKRIITTIILPGDPETKRKRALSALLKEIGKKGPSWYDPWSNRISRNFGTQVARLSEICKRMSRVFKKTIDGGPETLSNAEYALINSMLEEVGQSLACLSFDALRKAALADKTKSPLQTIDLLFKERMALLRSDALKTCAAGFRTAMKLAALCRFSFDETTALFRADAAPKGKAKETKKSLPVESILPQIQDLTFLISDLKLDAAGRDVFLRLHGFSGLDDYSAEQAAKDFDDALALAGSQLSGHLLQKTIKAAREDPFMEFTAYSVDVDIRKDVGTKLMQVFNERRAIMHKKNAEDALETRMRQVFGDMALPPLKGWGENEELKLVNAGLPALSGILTFSIMKNFLKIFYAPMFRVAISEAIMDLDFCDPQFRFNLSDEADEMGALIEDLQEFEESVAVPGHSQYAMVLGSIRGSLLDATVKLPCRKIIADANIKADALIQKIFAKTKALSMRLSNLREDLKNGKGLYVNKIIGGDTKKAVRARALIDAAQKIVFLDEILKHTAVDTATANRIIRQRGMQKD